MDVQAHRGQVPSPMKARAHRQISRALPNPRCPPLRSSHLLLTYSIAGKMAGSWISLTCVLTQVHMKRVQDFLCFDFAPKFTQNFEARLAWGMPLSSAVCIELCPSLSVPPVLPRRSVGRSVRPPTRPSVRPSVRPPARLTVSTFVAYLSNRCVLFFSWFRCIAHGRF